MNSSCALSSCAGRVAVKDLAVALLEGLDGGFARLPCGGGAEENSVPILVEEALAVIVPDGVELSGRAELLAVAGELLNLGRAMLLLG